MSAEYELKSKTESPSSQGMPRTHETEPVLEEIANKRVTVNVPQFEPLLDSAEAAALLKIHPKTLQRMARNREINGVQIGKLWRFRPSTLNQWLSQKFGRLIPRPSERSRHQRNTWANLRTAIRVA